MPGGNPHTHGRVHYADGFGMPACHCKKREPVVTSARDRVTCKVCLSILNAAERPEGKRCSRCEVTLAADAFYRDKAGKLSAQCVECSRRTALKWRYENHERSMTAKKAWSQRPEVKARRAAQERGRKHRHPEKFAARELIKGAIKRGELARQPCKECGDPRSTAHHHDYNKPMEIEWLCYRCHGIEHRRSPEGLAHAGLTIAPVVVQPKTILPVEPIRGAK